MSLPAIPKSTRSKLAGVRSDSLGQQKATSRGSIGQGNHSRFLPAIGSVDSSGLTVRQNVKRLCLWFRTWRRWQQRVCVCRVMEHCSGQHLELLATSLEPVLHLDFSSTLLPHMASLHLDSVTTFQVQRGVAVRMVQAEGMAEESLPLLDSLPTTLLTDTASADSERIQPDASQVPKDNSSPPPKPEKMQILPSIPLTHPQHATAHLFSHRSSLEGTVAIRRKRFSSVPDFKSTTDLLRHVKHKSSLKPRPAAGRTHRRSRSVGMPAAGTGWLNIQGRDAEHFKTQLNLVSEVRSVKIFVSFVWHSPQLSLFPPLLLSQWMGQWPPSQILFLLLELVKLCDKDLLGYLVQCLYQRSAS